MTFYIKSYPFQAPRAIPFRRMERSSNAMQPVYQRKLGINLREEEDAFILSALVPGLKSDDLNIQVLDDVIRIEGEYKPEDANYLVNELPAGSFTRTLRLPASVEADRVEARIADGVLTLRLPKIEAARPKKIKVNVK